MKSVLLPSSSLFPRQLHSPYTSKLLRYSSYRIPSGSSLIPKNSVPRPNSIRASSSAAIPIPDRDPGPLRDPISDSKQKRKQATIAGVIQDELLEPELLADPDSLFRDFRGVKIHHHVYESTTPSSSNSSSSSCSSPVILLHGFAASVSSWKPAMKPLSQSINSPVLAFDRPAFGLTSRVDPRVHIPNPYSMAFSVLLTLHFIDSLTPNKAVLIGHSAGCIVAVNTYFKYPHRISALILVAPAIFAPNQKPLRTNLFVKFFASIAKTMILILKTLSHYAWVVYKKALSLFLNSSFFVFLIRVSIDKFGVAAVRNAWYDRRKMTEESINGYLKPLKAKGWDKALAAFVSAMVLAEESEDADSLGTRMRGISCPVMVITGDSDRIVPAWNARKLADVIPGCSLEVIEKCGHLPHEEKLHEFVSAVSTFLTDRL